MVTVKARIKNSKKVPEMDHRGTGLPDRLVVSDSESKRQKKLGKKLPGLSVYT